MFHRIGEPALKPSLDNTIALCGLAGNPQLKFRSVHIAGTNGKGSSSHMLASILQKAGYKTGLYTSPHLKNFTERIRINGMEIPRNQVTGFVARYKPDFERIKPSFFEMTVALAFDYFAQEQVDVAVVEVGLGGRLDSTNIITPLVSLITNISFDHEKILGNSLPEIAFEKAGIIKPRVPVVVCETQPEVADVFISRSGELNSELIMGDSLYKVRNVRCEKGIFSGDVFYKDQLKFSGLRLDLGGSYQEKNLAGVLATVDILKTQGFALSDVAILDGLSSVVPSTGLKGRWQVLGHAPLIICDTGHNEAGIRYVTEQLHTLSYNRLHIVIGTVNDKNIDKILSLLPKEAVYYFTRPDIPRGLDAYALAGRAAAFGLDGKVIPSVKEAVREARNSATENDLIFIGGSNFVVAEIENL